MTRPGILLGPLALLVTLTAGCPGAPAPAPAVPPTDTEVSEAPTEPAAPVDEAPGLRVSLRAELEPAPRVHVHIDMVGAPSDQGDEALRVWSLPGPIAETPELLARDARGPLAASLASTDRGGLRVSFERAPQTPLSLDYALAPQPAEPGGVPRLELDDAHLFATGEALLLLPEAALDRRLPIELSVDGQVFAPADPEAPTGLPPLRAGTSFAADAQTQFEGWPFELRRAVFVAGQLEWARLDSLNGHDRWYGLGPTRFDQRWSAAELAGVRSFVDNRLGLPSADPMVTILRGASHAPSEPAFRAQLRGRGLLIEADENAHWDARARMAATQALVARWLGGRLRIRITKPETTPELADARALWFEAGVTRFVARELLWELGLLDEIEYAAELDAIERTLATSPLRERSLAELAQLVLDGASGDPAARRAAVDAQVMLAVRGAAYMAWIDHELRNAGQWSTDGVIELLRMQIAGVVAKGERDYPLIEFLGRVGFKMNHSDPPKDALLAMFEAVIDKGQRPPLASDSYGPCFRPRATKLRRFELGFVDTSLPGQAPSFAALDPEGPAARAGLRADDQLRELSYIPGVSDAPVDLVVERDGAMVGLRYLPAGPKQKAIRWQRVAGVAPETCVR